MPPKAKFTREEIIAAALELTREQGIEAVTARELGNRLNSSTRPIFTVFKNMEEVNAKIISAAKALYKQYVKKGLEQQLAFRGVGAAYIEFAVREPKLFQLLFMNEKQGVSDIDHILNLLDESYEDILKSVREPYHLQEETAKKLYRHLWVYTHGIATLCATRVCGFTGEEIEKMLTEVFISLLEKLKKGEVQ